VTGRHRPRTGTRRDGGVRVIRAAEVRYPGVELPPIESLPPEQSSDDPRSLRPARDTGLALEGRRARETRRRASQQRQQAIAGVVAVAVVGALAMGWQYSSDRRAKAEAFTSGLTETGPILSRTSAPSADLPIARAATKPAEPTPVFASYRSLRLRLPVSVDDLTELGFHQASYAYARRLKTKLPDADMTKAKKDRSTHRNKAEQDRRANALLTGAVLRMWRNRPGKPDTAVDVGANPGSDVLAPLDGTVVKVKAFKLYGKYDDYEIHIQPDGYPTIDCVMIHLEDVSCAPGDRVVAGVTRLAAVRKLAKGVGPQLRSYTANGGYHTHVQLNDATYPRYKGLEGAITVNATPDTPTGTTAHSVVR